MRRIETVIVYEDKENQRAPRELKLELLEAGVLITEDRRMVLAFPPTEKPDESFEAYLACLRDGDYKLDLDERGKITGLTLIT